MSTYYLGSGLTYQQYLQAKSFVGDITSAQKTAAKSLRLDVASQTRSLIASQEALARQHIRVMEAGLESLSRVNREGFESLSWDIQEVSRGISDEIARFSVESQRPSTFIDYATLAPFAMDGLGAALAMEDRNSGICL